MPLFAYFAVVGSFLLGLLFVAEAHLGPPKTLSITTNFHGLPEPWKSNKSTPTILTVRDAPAPHLATEAFAQSTVEPRTVAPAPAASKVAEVRKPKKAKKPSRDNPGGNVYAHSTNMPRANDGIVW